MNADRSKAEGPVPRSSRASGEGGCPLPDPLPVAPGRISGSCVAPASKSVTNRALILAASATGESVVSGASDSDDTRLLREALEQLGVSITESPLGTLTIHPPSASSSAPGEKSVRIDVGHAGTTVRFLLPILCRTPGEWIVDGSERMRERPIADLVKALRRLGGEIGHLGRDGFLPLEIRGGALRGGRVRLDASISSQFLSALLLSGPFLDGGIEVELTGTLASASYVRLTERSLASFGVPLESSGDSYRVGSQSVAGRRLALEGDWSGAAFLIGAAVLGGGPVTIRGLDHDSVQGDALFLEWVSRMGARFRWDDGLEVEAGESLRGIEVDASDAPDAVPALAVLAAFAEGETVVRGAANLRVKESDRLAAICEGVRNLGTLAEETPDGLRIVGDSPLLRRNRSPVTIRTRDDHRLAMAFALAGIAREGVLIENPGCVSKSFPGFWSVLESLRAK